MPEGLKTSLKGGPAAMISKIGISIVVLVQISMAAWVKVESGTTQHLSKVFFVNKAIGYAGGQVLLKTIDSGKTWAQVPGIAASGAIHFRNPDYGLVGSDSGRVYRTSNGGTTWQVSVTPGSLTGIYDVVLLDSTRALAIADKKTWISNNGGASWTFVDSVVPNGSKYQMCFYGKDTGYIAGGGSILKTTNGGSTWSIVLAMGSDPDFEYPVSSCSFVSAQWGYFTGRYSSSGRAFKTLNGGSDLSKNVLYPANKVVFASPAVGYVFGTLPNSFIKTSDSANTWTQGVTGTNALLRSMQFININYGFAVGDSGVILRTTDGGGFTVSIQGRRHQPPASLKKALLGNVFDALGRALLKFQ